MHVNKIILFVTIGKVSKMAQKAAKQDMMTIVQNKLCLARGILIQLWNVNACSPFHFSKIPGIEIKSRILGVY